MFLLRFSLVLSTHIYPYMHVLSISPLFPADQFYKLFLQIRRAASRSSVDTGSFFYPSSIHSTHFTSIQPFPFHTYSKLTLYSYSDLSLSPFSFTFLCVILVLCVAERVTDFTLSRRRSITSPSPDLLFPYASECIILQCIPFKE